MANAHHHQDTINSLLIPVMRGKLFKQGSPKPIHRRSSAANMFFVILFLIPLLTVLWLGWLWWRLRRVGGRGARWMRWFCLGTTAVVLLTYIWVIAQRMGGIETPPHPWLQALLLLWAIVFLPFLALPMMGGVALLDAGRALTRRIIGAEPEIPHTPSEIPGMRWSRREETMRQQVAALAQLHDPDAFPILLGHHPHAFDAAVSHGIPLTLSGHTHGGR